MNKLERKSRRKKRVRAKVSGTKKKPRISVFKSNKDIYVQLIDDEKENTLVSFSSKRLTKKEKQDKTKTQIAKLVGEKFAKEAKKTKVKMAVFDRGGYKYHGRVKALAEGARKGGLKF